MSSGFYKHLGVEDQADLRAKDLRSKGLEPEGCRAVSGPMAPGVGRPCRFPDGQEIRLGTPSAPAAGAKGPAIGAGQQDVGDALPFPGQRSVTCSQKRGDTGSACGLPVPGGKPTEELPGTRAPGPSMGVTASVTGTTSTNRGVTVLGADGIPRTTLDVTTDLRVTGGVEAQNGKAGGSRGVYAGDSSTYQVTVGEGRADAIAQGQDAAPNPYDPRSLQNGEGVQLAGRTYTGTEIKAKYDGLFLGDDTTHTHEVSSGVQRVNDSTARILVGDKQTVSNALSLGADVDGVGISASLSDESGRGGAKSVDLDISTPAGWDAYQRFVTTGELPPSLTGQSGVTDTVDSDSATWAKGAKAKVNAGPFSMSVGGNRFDGSVSEATHGDGRVDHSLTARDSGVTLRTTQTTGPDGTPVDQGTRSLDLQGADSGMLTLQRSLQTGGNGIRVDGDKNARITFSEADLTQIKQNALDSLSKGTQGTDQPMSPDEVGRRLQADPYAAIPNVAMTNGVPELIAASKSPDDVLRTIYLAAGGNPNQVLDILAKNHLDGNDARGADPKGGHAPGQLRVY